jgi:hypothetical protein
MLRQLTFMEVKVHQCVHQILCILCVPNKYFSIILPSAFGSASDVFFSYLPTNIICNVLPMCAMLCQSHLIWWLWYNLWRPYIHSVHFYIPLMIVICQGQTFSSSVSLPQLLFSPYRDIQTSKTYLQVIKLQFYVYYIFGI